MRIILYAVLFVVSVQVNSEALPAHVFSSLPQVQSPSLSPNGQQLAYIANLQNPQISLLTTLDLEKGKPVHLLKSDNEKVRINWFSWVNNKTLLISVRYAGKRNGTDTVETRLFAVEAGDSNNKVRLLIKPRSLSVRYSHVTQFQDRVIDMLPDDPDHILIALDERGAVTPSVFKLNVYTKKRKRIENGRRKIRYWGTDQQGRVRAAYAINYDSGLVEILVKKVNSDKWTTLFEYNEMQDKSISISGFALDPNIFYYKKYRNDKRALYKVDLSTMQHELVFADEEYDVNGDLIYSRATRDVVGLRHMHSEFGRIYFDKSLEKLHRGLNKALPDTRNYLLQFSSDDDLYLLYAEHDDVPGRYYVGRRSTNELQHFADQYPTLTPEVLPKHRSVTYTARDGTELEGYLTLPKSSKKPLPLVLHPHGGPGARDTAGFDYWTSFFVNEGYAVFRPNFRGSSGYGYSFSQKRVKGWGLAMQDDLTDAVNWLVKEGIVDSQRVCIVGASYGGYAAMMAAVKTPTLFKCAISYAGVSDLRRLVSDSKDYVGHKFVENEVGSKRSDLQARSPYYGVDKIQIPVLLLHGEDDRRVDVMQSRIMAKEMQAKNKQVKYVELENGDHYLSIQRNRHALFENMQEFLREHLGGVARN